MKKSLIIGAALIVLAALGIALYYFLVLNQTTRMQQQLTNEKTKSYEFLKDMYEDDYYPKPLVDKGREILIRLCVAIEARRPQNLDELYTLTHASTEEFNRLSEEFSERDSEIETVARDVIGMDFEYIAKAYGFNDADPEELIATRDW